MKWGGGGAEGVAVSCCDKRHDRSFYERTKESRGHWCLVTWYQLRGNFAGGRGIPPGVAPRGREAGGQWLSRNSVIGPRASALSLSVTDPGKDMGGGGGVSAISKHNTKGGRNSKEY